MTKKSKPQPNDDEQSKRFIETAKELASDESGKEFERVFGVIIPPKKEKQDPTE